MKNKILMFIVKVLAVILAIALPFLLIYGIGFVLSIVEPIVGPWLESDTGMTILFVVLLVGVNVLSYFASFVWGKRKPWFFWLGLFLTVICLIKGIDILL